MNKLYVGSPKENALYIFTGDNYEFVQKVGGDKTSFCETSFLGLGNSISTDKYSNLLSIGAYLTSTNYTFEDGMAFLLNQEPSKLSKCNIVNKNTLTSKIFKMSDSFISGQKLSGNNNNSEYGFSVDINDTGNVIIIGGPNDNNLSGGALIFTGNSEGGWLLKQTITGTALNSLFGYNLSTNHDASVIAISAPNENFNRGSVSLYTGNANLGWKFKQKITGVINSKLGTSIDISSDGNIIAIGAPDENFNQGSVNLYKKNSSLDWVFQQKISGTFDSNFGSKVAINSTGDIIVIGAPNDSDFFYQQAGAVYIYTTDSMSQWSLNRILTNNPITTAQNYGVDVDINNVGDIILIKDSTTNIFNVYRGNKNNGWYLAQRIEESGSCFHIDNNNNIILGNDVLKTVSLYTFKTAECYYNNQNTSQIFSGGERLGTILLQSPNSSNVKMDYIECIDSGATSASGWENIYNRLVIWDGEQSGTNFKDGDTIKFNIDLNGRVNPLALYNVSVIDKDQQPSGSIFFNTQGLIINCASIQPKEDIWNLKQKFYGQSGFGKSITSNGEIIVIGQNLSGNKAGGAIVYKSEDLIWVESITSSGFKKGYGQILDPGYHIPFINRNIENLNPYRDLIFWDGVQSGIFKNNDIVKFNDDLDGRINLNNNLNYNVEVINDFELNSKYSGNALIIRNCLISESLAPIKSSSSSSSSSTSSSSSSTSSSSSSLFISNLSSINIFAGDNSFDYFGNSVDISDDENIIVVGAPFDDNLAGNNAGAAFIYQKFNDYEFNLIEKISGISTNGENGFNVAANHDGSIIFIGNRSLDGGSILLYQRSFDNQWVLRSNFTNPTTDDASVFGRSFSINSNGDLLVVGAPREEFIVYNDLVIPDVGKVYIYSGLFETPIYTLNPTDDPFYENVCITPDQPCFIGLEFGKNVAISRNSNCIAVGAPGNVDYDIDYNGGIFIYDKNLNWQIKYEFKERLINDIQPGNGFGRGPIVMNSDATVMVVSVPLMNSGERYEIGGAYIYTRNINSNWNLKQIITGDQNNGGRYGSSVSMDSMGKYIILGSESAGVPGLIDGGCLLFSGNKTLGWKFIEKFTGVREHNSQFGKSSAISSSGFYILIGAPRTDINPDLIDAGAGYLYYNPNT